MFAFMQGSIGQILSFNITRPKPAYGRQGLDWIVGPDYRFVVFSTNKTMETMKNHETTLKNQGNQPKTMKNHETTLKNHGNQPKTMKNHETTLKTLRHQQRVPTDFLWCKYVTVTNTGPKPTSFDAKTLPSLTRGANRPFRCLD